MFTIFLPHFIIPSIGFALIAFAAYYGINVMVGSPNSVLIGLLLKIVSPSNALLYLYASLMLLSKTSTSQTLARRLKLPSSKLFFSGPEYAEE